MEKLFDMIKLPPIKLCVFSSFEACSKAQHYDHLYQKAIDFASVTGIDLNIVREKNLNLQENGVFLIDKYIEENNIIPVLPAEFDIVKKYWLGTNAWSKKFKLGDLYVYFKDHSDRSYEIIEIESTSNLIPLDEEGNEILNYYDDIVI